MYLYEYYKILYVLSMCTLCLHLIHLVPFGFQTFFDGLASEVLVADQQPAIWIRFTPY